MNLILRRLQAVMNALAPSNGSKGNLVKIDTDCLRKLKTYLS